MSKADRDETTVGLPTEPQAWVEPPQEFNEGTTDLAAYWESASPQTAKRGAVYGSPPVSFTPLHVTLSDSRRDVSKTSTLIHCRLEAPCVLRSSNKEEGLVTFPAGTLFGIWAKPGMKPLKRLAGVKVWMANGQKNPRGDVTYFKEFIRNGEEALMVVYTIKWPKGAEGTLLKVMEDHRVESLPDAEQQRRQRRAARAAERANSEESGYGDLEDLPF